MDPLPSHTLTDHKRPLRLLVVMPSWLGDCVMATPALRLLRTALKGSYIGAMLRPGMDELLAGSDFFDEIHVERASGVMGPKFAAAKLRPRRYDTALLLSNSLRTALTARIAGIPRRVGYSRDARGFLLTDRLHAPLTTTGPRTGEWLPIPAVSYYSAAAATLLGLPPPSDPAALPPGAVLELGVTPEQHIAAATLLARAGVDAHTPLVLLNPGGNKPEKRWPPDRYAKLADDLAAQLGVRALVNGSPGELDVLDAVCNSAASAPVNLARHGITIGSLKALLASRRVRLMVTNDTGPRHIAAAFGVPVVTLFGPTDHRWTTIPTRPDAPEAILLADPTLPADLLADDHPERCRIDRIAYSDVLSASLRVFSGPGNTLLNPSGSSA